MLVNKYRIVGDVAYISLTLGQETMIDVADLEKALKVRWHAAYNPAGNAYRARGSFRGKPVFLHRYILDCLDSTDGLHIDHINRNSLDNRRANLRLVTPAVNAQNKGEVSRTNETGILGVTVHRHKDVGKPHYVAMVIKNGKKQKKHFPYTPEGLDAATKLVQIWREDFDYVVPGERDEDKPIEHTGNYAPIARSTSKTGVYGVSIHKGSTKLLYVFRCHHKKCKTTKYFPFTDEGLEAARQFSNQHHELA